MIYNHKLESASILAKQLKATSSNTPNELHLDSNLYIIALKDEHILNTVSKLNLKNQLIAHTSGTFDTQKLMHFSSRSACFYPMQTLKKDQNISIDNTAIFIESNHKKDRDSLKALCQKIKCIPYIIDFEQRQKIHIAAIATNNFTYHLFSCIQEYCKVNNLPYSSLAPLFSQTIKMIEKGNPFTHQTGPAIRRENEILEKHLELLKNENFLADIYSLFTKQIMKKHQDNEL